MRRFLEKYGSEIDAVVFVCEDDTYVSNSYTMVCLPVRGDNPQALVMNYLLCRWTDHGYFMLKFVILANMV